MAICAACVHGREITLQFQIGVWEIDRCAEIDVFFSEDMSGMLV